MKKKRMKNLKKKYLYLMKWKIQNNSNGNKEIIEDKNKRNNLFLWIMYI